jgi:hypothetical protein
VGETPAACPAGAPNGELGGEDGLLDLDAAPYRFERAMLMRLLAVAFAAVAHAATTDLPPR